MTRSNINGWEIFEETYRDVSATDKRGGGKRRFALAACPYCKEKTWRRKDHLARFEKCGWCYQHHRTLFKRRKANAGTGEATHPEAGAIVAGDRSKGIRERVPAQSDPLQSEVSWWEDLDTYHGAAL